MAISMKTEELTHDKDMIWRLNKHILGLYLSLSNYNKKKGLQPHATTIDMHNLFVIMIIIWLYIYLSIFFILFRLWHFIL